MAAMNLNAVVVAIFIAVDAQTVVRPFCVFVFLVLGPGLAATSLMRFESLTTELAIAVPASLAVGALLATIASFARVWDPGGIVFSAAVDVVIVLSWRLFWTFREAGAGADADTASVGSGQQPPEGGDSR